MTKQWLLLDGNYLAYRAFYSTGQLAEGIVFGFLKEVMLLQHQYRDARFVFCFDAGKSRRQLKYPEYKANRNSRTPEEQLKRKEIRQQIRKLRDEILTEMGFRNVLFQKGYEADDCIAVICKNLPPDEEVLIVSTDHDLYQLLEGERIKMFIPKERKEYTEDEFKKQWKLAPVQWVMVKAMAGCSSDNVAGIEGVGEITAAKFLRGEIKEGSAIDKKIQAGEDVWKRNLKLVRLPLKGTPVFELQEDEFSLQKWKQVVTRLKMTSLLERIPTSWSFSRKCSV